MKRKKPMFLLLLKQGIRGVFKFKIQFVIIVILSFIASFIVSASLSTIKRLDNNYDNVMDKMEPFDYSTTFQLGAGETASASDQVNTPYNDFINNQNLASGSINNDGVFVSYNNDGLNLNTSSFNLKSDDKTNFENTYNETFITKAFASTEFKQEFTNYIKYKALGSGGGYNLGGSFIKYEYNPLTAEYSYTPMSNWETEGSSSSYKLMLERMSPLLVAFDHEARIELKKDLASHNESLKNTTIQKLIDKKIFSVNDISSEPTENGLVKYDNYLNEYVDVVVQEVLQSVDSLVSHYANDLFTEAVSEYKESSSKEETKSDNDNDKDIDMSQFGTWFNSTFFNEHQDKTKGFYVPYQLDLTYVKDGKPVYHVPADKELNVNELSEYIYEYIYGKVQNDSYKTNPLNSRFIVDGVNVKPWAEQILSNPKGNTITQVLEDDKNLLEYGLRGSVNQLRASGFRDEKTHEITAYSLFKQTQSTNALKGQDNTHNLSSSLSVIGSLSTVKWLDVGVYSGDTNIAMEVYLKYYLNALVNGFEYHPRIEIQFTDNVIETQFRGVALSDYWKSKITLLAGTMPSSSNELLISPGYAYKNHINIGDGFYIGGGLYIISGYASDPLSFIPSSDTTVPFPNTSHGAIIYGSFDALSHIGSHLFNRFISATLTGYYNDMTGNSNTIGQRFDNFKYDLFDSQKSVSNNSKYIQGYDVQGTNDIHTSAFTDDLLNMNWTLYPSIISYFRIAIIAFSALIMVLAVIAASIAIRKTIQMNSKQIGILKAMGAKPGQISTSYLSYSIIVLFVVVPIAFFTGVISQEILSRMFLPYFSGVHNVFLMSYVAFIVSFCVFGLITLIASYTIAYVLTNKPTLVILANKRKEKRSKIIDFAKDRIFKKSKFTLRFSLDLASSGANKTIMLTSTLFATGFLISGCIAIPSIVANINSAYYKAVSYNNQAELYQPTGNAPLTKTSFAAWQGPDYYNENYNGVDGFFGNGVDGFYDKWSDISGNRDNSVFPKFLLSQDKNNKDTLAATWAIYSVVKGITDSNNASREESEEQKNALLNVIGSVFGNNFKMAENKNFGIVDAETAAQLIMLINKDKYSKENDPNQLQRKRDVEQTMSFFNDGIPQIVGMIMGMGSSVGNGDNWKAKLINVIMSAVPQYMKQYVTQNENRENQFAFGYQATSYIPGRDNFYTKTTLSDTDGEQIELMGLQGDQTAYQLSKKTNNIFLADGQAEQIQSLFRGQSLDKDVVLDDGFVVYDHNSKILNVPLIANENANVALPWNNNKISGVSSSPNRLKTLDGMDVPNNAFMYDDRDYKNLLSNTYGQDIKDIPDWLSVSELDGNKLTYAPIYNYESNPKDNGVHVANGPSDYKAVSLKDNSYGFADFYKTKNGELKTRIRPYYSFDNIYLFLPKSVGQGLDNISGVGSTTSKYWYGEVNDSNIIPESTRKEWDMRMDQHVSDYVWVRPYTLRFDPAYNKSAETENLSGKALGWLLQRAHYWWGEAMYGKTGTTIPFAQKADKLDIQKITNHGIEKVNLVKRGILPTYSGKTIITDQKLANILNGFPVKEYIPYNYVMESKQEGGYTLPNGQNVKTYDLASPNSLVSPNVPVSDQIFGKGKQKDERPEMWFSGILSNDEEAYYITSQANFTRTPKIGAEMINAATESDYGSSLNDLGSVTFLSQQKALISQITSLVLTVGIILIICIILVSTLSVMLISDLYINQYKRFMIVMKSLGYSNWKITKYVMGTSTIIGAILFVVGMLLSYLVIFSITKILANGGVALPIGIAWWSPFLSIVLIVISYVTSVSIATHKVRNTSPSLLLSSSAE